MNDRIDAPARLHNAVREGVVAGALAATVVATWFLIVDLVAAEVFFTPVRLGRAFGQVFGITPMATSDAAAFIGFTLLHYLAFIAITTLAAAIVHASRTQPSLIAGAFLAFVVAEVLIYVFIVVLHATELLEHLAWWLIAVGNLLAAAVIGWKLWRDHPGLGRAIDSALGGRA